jgi:hypothetical protein
VQVEPEQARAHHPDNPGSLLHPHHHPAIPLPPPGPLDGHPAQVVLVRPALPPPLRLAETGRCDLGCLQVALLAVSNPGLPSLLAALAAAAGLGVLPGVCVAFCGVVLPVQRLEVG